MSELGKAAHQAYLAYMFACLMGSPRSPAAIMALTVWMDACEQVLAQTATSIKNRTST